jgi:small subunit ribosomal protein S16
MVRIRLRRVGAKKQPHYRVVVADQNSPRDGRHIETIGYYDPRTEPETVVIDEDRALYWLSVGAQPTDIVQRFLDKRGTMARLSRLKAGEPMDALVAEYEGGVGAPEGTEPVEQVAGADFDASEVDAVMPEAEVPEAEEPAPEEEVIEISAEPDASAESEGSVDAG